MPPAESVASAAANSPEKLSHELCVELWARVIARLETREVFTANVHFQIAIEEEFHALTGEEPDTATKLYIHRMVQTVNTMHPQTYLAQGVQNGIARAFEEGVRKLKWDVAKIQANGSRAMRRFSRTDTVRDLLQDVNVRLDHDALLGCVNDAVEAVVRQNASSEEAIRIRDAARARQAQEREAGPLEARHPRQGRGGEGRRRRRSSGGHACAGRPFAERPDSRTRRRARSPASHRIG